ncbi:MAG: hypothetical protein Q9224_004586 [Gallowayella concinna]
MELNGAGARPPCTVLEQSFACQKTNAKNSAAAFGENLSTLLALCELRFTRYCQYQNTPRLSAAPAPQQQSLIYIIRQLSASHDSTTTPPESPYTGPSSHIIDCSKEFADDFRFCRKEETMQPPQQHEFHSFPPAVKRKSRPKLGSRNSSYFRASPGRLARKPSSPSDRFSFEDAQWFQRLPDKVQQKHFTKEEQRALAGHTESPILDAADEVILRARRQRIRSLPTIRTSSSCSSTSSVHTLEEEQSVDSAVDMDESILDSFRWMDDDEDLDLTLDDYHSHLVGSAQSASTHSSRRPSFRRTLSLTALPQRDTHCPKSTERAARSPPPPLLRPASPQGIYHQDSLRSQADHQDSLPLQQTTARTTDQSAKHYQDPEARLKLRVYLASPSKFDEALEFGFPSLESTEDLPQPRRPSLSRTYHTEPAPQTFYDSENPSFLDSSDSDFDDAESLPEMDAPNTPSDAVFFRNAHRLPTSNPASSDVNRPFSKPAPRLNFKPMDPLQPQHQPLVGAGCNREMTLRMTLTRPDLRASDDLLYGSGDNDPLALEHLPSPVAGNDIWDQGKEGGGTVRKLWRKVSGR